jgi:hypothetical protein
MVRRRSLITGVLVAALAVSWAPEAHADASTASGSGVTATYVLGGARYANGECIDLPVRATFEGSFGHVSLHLAKGDPTADSAAVLEATGPGAVDGSWTVCPEDVPVGTNVVSAAYRVDGGAPIAMPDMTIEMRGAPTSLTRVRVWSTSRALSVNATVARRYPNADQTTYRPASVLMEIRLVKPADGNRGWRTLDTVQTDWQGHLRTGWPSTAKAARMVRGALMRLTVTDCGWCEPARRTVVVGG